VALPNVQIPGVPDLQRTPWSRGVGELTVEVLRQRRPTPERLPLLQTDDLGVFGCGKSTRHGGDVVENYEIWSRSLCGFGCGDESLELVLATAENSRVKGYENSKMIGGMSGFVRIGTIGCEVTIGRDLVLRQLIVGMTITTVNRLRGHCLSFQ
jgi:hypothetical protein